MGIALKVAGNSSRRIQGKQWTGGWGDELYQNPNPWKKYKLKLLPKKINGKWYKPGEWVYRKRSFGPGGAGWIYGDHFDFMRGS